MPALTSWRPGLSACCQPFAAPCSELTPYSQRRLIKWVQFAYPTGGHHAQLRPLLERCTRELQPQQGYKQDPRYLRVWLQYVRLALSQAREQA